MATNHATKPNSDTAISGNENTLKAVNLSELLNTSLGKSLENQIGKHLIKNLAREALSNKNPQKSLSNYFFEHPSTVETKEANGIVETPRSIAAFMINLAYSRWSSAQISPSLQKRSCHWFDPCGGGGVFPVEILRFYITDLGIVEPRNLPTITVSEISDIGIASIFLSIATFLESSGISAIEYFNLEKLRLEKGDTLTRYPEAPDMFSKKILFDIVVGNPPYVRASKINPAYKKVIQAMFPDVFSGSADLYTYFVSSGISYLSSNGVLVYISPASFTRSKNGTALRDWLTKTSSLDTFIDMDETKVFEDADLHASIYVMRKGKSDRKTARYLRVSTKDNLDNLLIGAGLFSDVLFISGRGSGWSFHSSIDSFERFKRTFSDCTEMSDLGLKVYSGIRPGCSAAFILNADQFDKFSQRAKDKWIRPLVLPSDILRWSGMKKCSYLIVIPSTCTEIDDEIQSFLLPFQGVLQNRSEIKDDKKWFTLRPCSYYDEMEKKKIAFPDLSAHQRFSLVDKEVYVPDGAYFIDTSNLVILGILNSSLAKKYFVERCASVGNLESRGRFRFKKEFVKNFPLPKNCLEPGIHQNRIHDVVAELVKNGETNNAINEVNYQVQKLYEDQ